MEKAEEPDYMDIDLSPPISVLAALAGMVRAEVLGQSKVEQRIYLMKWSERMMSRRLGRDWRRGRVERKMGWRRLLGVFGFCVW